MNRTFLVLLPRSPRAIGISRTIGIRLAIGIPLVLGLLWAPAVLAEPSDFPRPAALEGDVAFWKRIYSEVGTTGGLLHDTRDLRVVYEVVQLPKGLSGRARERHTDQLKKKYSTILATLASGKRSGLSREESRVLRLFGTNVSNTKLRNARNQIRFQLGQADKFRAGVIRSGAYKPHILRVLRDMGLPEEIANLPHVESSYTPTVYSRVGAAGLWQFTRSTGRRFMQVDHVVDERLDPYRASVAAARLLEQNYRVTGSWPLAITAYNHGASGMRRAAKQLGTKDITTIVRKYKSRTFGFASRNFYVEFLAANAVASNATTYFGPLKLDRPIEYEEVEIPFYAKPTDVARATGVDLQTLKAANPGLRPAVWKGDKYIPKGFEIRVPRDSLPRPLARSIASMSAGQQYARQTRDETYTVRRGDTLSKIASRHGVRMSQLMSLNGIKSKHRIRVGQKIRLPSGKGSDPALARPTSKPASVQSVATLPSDGVYVVRRGDNLSKIADQFGMSVGELVELNALRSRHRIAAGQKLRVRAAEPVVVAKADTQPISPAEAKSPATPLPAQETPIPKPAVVVAAVAAEDALPEAPATSEADLEGDVEAEEGVAPESSEDAAPETTHDESAVEPSPGLLADPSDYTVSRGRTIIVQPNETLGHYADWLGLRASELRRLNGMRYGQPLVVQSKLKLDFSKVPAETFERVRVEYHRVLQEEFFAQWEIEGTTSHRVGAGDSLWLLSTKRFDVPIWLLRQYNPDVDLDSLAPGVELTVPKLRERTLDDTPQATTLPAAAANRAS